MIYIEMPLWLAILIAIALSFLLFYLCVSDFFIKLINKKYDLSLTEKKNKILEDFKKWLKENQ